MKLAKTAISTAGAVLLTAGVASYATAQSSIPESGALVSMPVADAASCTKKYMAAKKAYYVALDGSDHLIFERPTMNPYASIFRPNSMVYERVHVRFQRVADTTRVLTYYQIVVAPLEKHAQLPILPPREKTGTITEYGHPDMKLSHRRAAKLARWIKKQPSPDHCY